MLEWLRGASTATSSSSQDSGLWLQWRCCKTAAVAAAHALGMVGMPARMGV